MIKKCIVHIRTLKQALNHVLVLPKVHRVFEFNQKTWKKSHNSMNTELKEKAKNDSWKNIFKIMKNSVFGKTI